MLLNFRATTKGVTGYRDLKDVTFKAESIEDAKKWCKTYLDDRCLWDIEEVDTNLYQCECGFKHYRTMWITEEWVVKGCPKCSSYSFKTLPEVKSCNLTLEESSELFKVHNSLVQK